MFKEPPAEPPVKAPVKTPPPMGPAMLNAPPPEAPAMFKEPHVPMPTRPVPKNQSTRLDLYMVFKAAQPEAPVMFKAPPPEVLAKLKAAPPVVPAMIKAAPPKTLAMSKAPAPPHAPLPNRPVPKVWPKSVPTRPKVEQIRRFKEHSLNLEPPPKPKPVAKPKPMPEAEPIGGMTVVSPGDPYYATDGVPWLQCRICHDFQPDALTIHCSRTSLCGRERTYRESQQQEAALARQRELYWHRVSSECECEGGRPCDACDVYGCPICGRYDRCPCVHEDIVLAEEGRLMHRLEMEAAWRREMQFQLQQPT